MTAGRYPSIMTTAPPVRDELVEIDGLRFHYRDWPSRRDVDAPALLLLHGFTGHARSWDPLAGAMTDRYRVLALDLRGHGETDWAPADRYGADDMVGDVQAFVQALGLERVALLGLSFGGLVATIYAGLRPSVLTACVVVDIGPEMAPAGAARIRSNVTAGDVFETRDAAFAVARAENGVPPAALHRERCYQGLMRTDDGRWTYRYDRALRRPGTLRVPESAGVWRSCENIVAPTLVVRGARSDILSPEIAERMVATIPRASLVTIADAGHGVPYDAPESFAAAIRGFLKG